RRWQGGAAAKRCAPSVVSVGDQPLVADSGSSTSTLAPWPVISSILLASWSFFSCTVAEAFLITSSPLVWMLDTACPVLPLRSPSESLACLYRSSEPSASCFLISAPDFGADKIPNM